MAEHRTRMAARQPGPAWAMLLLALLTCGATCNHETAGGDAGADASASAGPKIELPGVDTSSLTAREHVAWSTLVGELLSPCQEVAVPVAQCVKEKRPCRTCLPAAQFLVRQVQGGRPKNEISEVYAARFAHDRVKTIVVGGSPSLGPADAPITIVEFADFECPACGMAYPLLELVKQKFSGKLRFVYKHFPLPAHPHARLAAQAAFAAQKQGQFWAMHKTLFEAQDRLTEPDLYEHARALGLDLVSFRRDMHSEEAVQRVSSELQQGEGLGVDATPTLYINGRDCDLSKLADPVREIDEWIRLELELAGQTVPPAPSASVGAMPFASGAPQLLPSAVPPAGSAGGPSLMPSAKP